MRACSSWVCAVSDSVVAREIEGDLIIVPLMAGIADAEDELYSLNATGCDIWNKLDGVRTLAQVVEELESDYESDAHVVERDVLGLVDELVRRGMLTVVA